MNTERWGLRSRTEFIECGSPMAFPSVFILHLFCLTGGTFIGLAKTSTTAAPVRTQHASYTGISTNCDLFSRAGSCGSTEHTSRMPTVQKAGRGRGKHLSLKMEGVCAMLYLVLRQGLFFFFFYYPQGLGVNPLMQSVIRTGTHPPLHLISVIC